MRRRLATDPFLRARLELVALYFVAGSLIYVFLSWLVGSYLRRQLYAVVLWQDGDPALRAIALFEHQMYLLRVVTIVLFAGAALLITEFALRPVRKAAELQRRFVAIVSHELRTPLTVIRNESEVALRNRAALTPERAAQVIESNLEEVDRLARTLQFFLTFSDLKDRNRIGDLVPVRLEAAADGAARLLEKEGVQKGVRLVLETAGTHEVSGNAVALEGLAFNLMHNALQHTPAGGEVRVRVEDGRAPRLVVSDTGSGIAPRDLPYLFQPFYRGVGAAPGGVGLGLSIVREIAELHHATVEVTSEAGKGSTFAVRFPRAIIHTRARARA